MYILQTIIKNNLLNKIIKILKLNFPELFDNNTQGRPRKYSLGKTLALVVYQTHSSNLSFRKIDNSLKMDALSLEILEFETVPNFTVIFKSYTKYLKANMNIYLQTIGSQIHKNGNTFYLDSSFLITSKLDKEARLGKSTRFGWYNGYKLHLICDSQTTANIHDSRCEYLIDSLSKIKPGANIIADKGYDVSRLLKYSKDLNINLICPLNKRKLKLLN